MVHNPNSQQSHPSHQHKAHLTIKQSCEHGSCDNDPATNQPAPACENCPNLKDRLMTQTLKEIFGI